MNKSLGSKIENLLEEAKKDFSLKLERIIEKQDFKFCPFCGKRLVKENKKEVTPFTPERFEDSTVILKEEKGEK